MITEPVAPHPASIAHYIRHGWSLVPIPPGTKGPHHKGWNQKRNALQSPEDLPPGFGIGLAHAYSGTMALDIDDWDRAREELAAHGIDLDALYTAPDAVVVSSGRAGHGKLLYAMPVPMQSKKLSYIGPNGLPVNYLDFRCATSNGLTMQDVLPPTIHPDTRQPYRWAGNGAWTRLPVIPDDLVSYWQSLLAVDRSRVIDNGEAIHTSWDEIHDALTHISADCSREEWINVGMALHWAGTQTGNLAHALDQWNEWSKTSIKYPGYPSILTQWRSFTADKMVTVRLGTLFHLARAGGWKRPVPDASSLFSSIGGPPMAPAEVLPGLRPLPPDIDMTLFPEVLSRRAEELSRSIGGDPLVSLWAGLAAACAVADARSRLELMPGYQVPPILWLMVIGRPAAKKTPGSGPMFSVLNELEMADRARFLQDMLSWEAKEAAHAASKKEFLTVAASPEHLMGAPLPPVVELPPQPVPLRLEVSDVTSQKLIRLAADRPAGILCNLDEMNSWLAKIEDPKSGEDRSAWARAYESKSYIMDRVGAGTIVADNLAISIFGNVQPAVFERVIKNLSTDGVIQRFLPAVLRDHLTRVNEPIEEWLTNRAQWDQTLRIIHALPVTTYHLSPEAYAHYREFQIWYAQLVQDEQVMETSNSYMTALGKLEGTTGRLAFLFHLIESPFAPAVSGAVMERVVRLVRSYVIPALRYTLHEIAGDADSLDQWMKEHVIQNAGEVSMLTLSGLKRSARRKLVGCSPWQATQRILDSMEGLEQSRWVARIEERLNQGHVTWLINPSLATAYVDERQRVIDARQRHVDNAYRYAYAKGYSRKTVTGFRE